MENKVPNPPYLYLSHLYNGNVLQYVSLFSFSSDTLPVLVNTVVISAFLPLHCLIYQHVLERGPPLKELAPQMWEKVKGSSFVILQL